MQEMSKEYLTVKEFAAEAGISQQAVYKQLNGRLKNYVVLKGNQKLIASEAIKQYYSPSDSTTDSTNSTDGIKVEQPDLADLGTDPMPDIQPKVEEVENEDSTQNPEKKKQKELEEKIVFLQDQIRKILENEQEEKKFLRDQILQKDKQIESLNDNLKMAQQLAAADKKKLLELEEKQQEVIITNDPDPAAADPPAAEIKEEPKRKSFWSWLFG